MRITKSVRREIEIEACDRCEVREAIYAYEMQLIPVAHTQKREQEAQGISRAGALCETCADLVFRSFDKRKVKAKNLASV